MSVSYHVYRNDSLGGPVDFATPVATVSAPTWTSPTLATPSDTIFAVRAFDTVTGLEESNVDAVARIARSASGADITSRPGPPTGLTAIPAVGGDVVVRWQYPPLAAGSRPTGFRVWATAGTGPVVFASSPALTVPFDSAAIDYHATLTGLTDGASYAIGVRAYLTSPAIDDGNAGQVVATADATGPLAVDGLAAVAV